MASKRRKRRGSRSWDEERRFTVRGVRRDPPDIGKLSKALVGLAMAEVERQAQAEQAAWDAEPEVTAEDPEDRAQSGGGVDAQTR